jgi:hypothetical protein
MRRYWRRAALALDDYRTAIGPDRFRAIKFDKPPSDHAHRELHEHASRDIDTLEFERSRVRRHGRER